MGTFFVAFSYTEKREAFRVAFPVPGLTQRRKKSGFCVLLLGRKTTRRHDDKRRSADSWQSFPRSLCLRAVGLPELHALGRHFLSH